MMKQLGVPTASYFSYLGFRTIYNGSHTSILYMMCIGLVTMLITCMCIYVRINYKYNSIYSL